MVALTLLVAFVAPARAEVVTLKDETPAVSVDVPEAFTSKPVSRGIQANTPDGGIYVWFETYMPDEEEALLKEHNEYWAQNGVDVGDQKEKVTKEAGGKTIIATDFKAATWKGKPTVIRYLFIDAGLPSKKLILMSVWASPEADEAHDADVMKLISSLKIGE